MDCVAHIASCRQLFRSWCIAGSRKIANWLPRFENLHVHLMVGFTKPETQGSEAYGLNPPKLKP